MLDALNQFKEETAFRLFGRSRRLAIAGNQCVKCGEFDLWFRDELSRKEHGISGFCQSCQDDIFGLNDEDKEETLSAAKDAIPGFFVSPEALDGLEN
jgi:hypothetical protein